MKEQALIIVDMQKYYLSNESSYFRYFNYCQPGCLDYIICRCRNTVIPNIVTLIDVFKSRSQPIIYLRLCGNDPERKDLHHFFRDTFLEGQKKGYDNIYPLETDPMSGIIDSLKPSDSNIIINKTTFSPFTSSNIHDILKEKRIRSLVFSGLATSQCVDTSSRDASDHGYEIIHIDDAEADYDEYSHNSSLFSSQGVCGGKIYHTSTYISSLK